MIRCPVCEQEGQPITCIAGNRETHIVYHPQKITRTICHLTTEVTEGEADGK